MPLRQRRAAGQAVASLPTLQGSLAFTDIAEAGEAVEALGQACGSIQASAAALGVDTSTRAAAEAGVAEASATIDMFWLSYDRLNALLEAIANGGFPPPVEDCDEYLEVAFPMTAHLRSNRLPGQEGKAWHMETWITVFDTGQLDGKTRIWSSEALRGFHGGVTVLAKDEGVMIRNRERPVWPQSVFANAIFSASPLSGGHAVGNLLGTYDEAARYLRMPTAPLNEINPAPRHVFRYREILPWPELPFRPAGLDGNPLVPGEIGAVTSSATGRLRLPGARL